MGVFYLCDRRACEKCSPECHHTDNIFYAKNFKLGVDGVTMVEKQTPIVFLKSPAMLKQKDVARIRRLIDIQIPSGVVMVPSYIDIITPNDTEHPVKFYTAARGSGKTHTPLRVICDQLGIDYSKITEEESK